MNALSGIPSPAVERSKIFFHWRVELPGWGRGCQEGARVGGHRSGCSSTGQGPPPPPPTPHSIQKGVEINGPLHLLRPVLLLIQLDDMYLTDSCTVFTIADSKHLHAHQFLR